MCVYVCAREKKRERKRGEGGSGLRQGEKEKANVDEKDKARKRGVERVSYQDDVPGFISKSTLKDNTPFFSSLFTEILSALHYFFCGTQNKF